MPDSTKTDRQGQTAKREQERGNKGQKQKSTHIMPRKHPHPLMMSHNYAVCYCYCYHMWILNLLLKYIRSFFLPFYVNTEFYRPPWSLILTAEHCMLDVIVGSHL